MNEFSFHIESFLYLASLVAVKMTATFVLMSTLRHLQPVTFSHWVPMKQHFWCSRPIRRFFVANASTFRKSGLGRPNIAIAGSTGAVGVELLACLSKRKFPFNSIKLLASARSAGSIQEFMGQKLLVEELNEDSFHDVDIALFSAGGTQSKRYAPAAVKAGCIVIDNSSAFRMDPTVPLVVPEVNPEAVHSHKGIIANPNCSTIIMNVAVWPLYQLSRISRIVVSTYQAASGAGAAAMRELEMQAHDWVQGRPLSTDIFSRQYLWNLFSHDSSVDAASGYNEEELKMMQETRKIFADEHIQVTATCIRVPVLRAHCESINLSFTSV